MTQPVRNQRLSDEQFHKIRKEEVLPQWETGRHIEDLGQCIEIARELSEGKSHALKLKEAKENGEHIVFPQFGRALTEYVLEGLEFVEQESNLAPHGIWNIYSDSYTRKNDYRSAAAG